ncbi:MAG: hypothetical protein SCH66_10270 [Methanolobus sp.]|nr:hypothetical protein [Methanolobus sp.]
MELKTIIVSLLVLTVLLSLPMVSARPAYLEAFKEQYDTGDTKLDTCNTCHENQNGGGPRNPYGTAFENNNMDFVSIEDQDSDGDGFTNLEEINALTFPGNSEDHPQTGSDTQPETDVNETDPAGDPATENTTAPQNEEPLSDLPSDQQASGFGALLTIIGIVSAIYWYRKG